MTNDELRAKLEEELDVVVQELADLGEEDIDQTATEEHGENLSEKATLSARKKEITQALMRMREGTYGTCEECGEKIQDDRLEANPAARTCMAHMEL